MSAEMTVADFIRPRPRRNVFTAKGMAYLSRPQPAIIYDIGDPPNPRPRPSRIIYASPAGPFQHVSQKATERVMARRIVSESAQKYGITTTEVYSDHNFEALVQARHEAYYRIRFELKWSLKRIAYMFGRRDHSGVIHGIRRHAQRLLNNGETDVQETRPPKKAPKRTQRDREASKARQRERWANDPVYREYTLQKDRERKARKRALNPSTRPPAKVDPEIAAFRESVWGQS